ncbi:hypothetical protein [Helicobacter suis]|uniref:hypothetical protein n=1 Tax=Helicobacter suis TaxID=104628 RepID=UPI0013153A57|nr:hypothetical protein [Helicobacter suis]
MVKALQGGREKAQVVEELNLSYIALSRAKKSLLIPSYMDFDEASEYPCSIGEIKASLDWFLTRVYPTQMGEGEADEDEEGGVRKDSDRSYTKQIKARGN